MSVFTGSQAANIYCVPESSDSGLGSTILFPVKTSVRPPDDNEPIQKYGAI